MKILKEQLYINNKSVERLPSIGQMHAIAIAMCYWQIPVMLVTYITGTYITGYQDWPIADCNSNIIYLTIRL